MKFSLAQLWGAMTLFCFVIGGLGCFLSPPEIFITGYFLVVWVSLFLLPFIMISIARSIIIRYWDRQADKQDT